MNSFVTKEDATREFVPQISQKTLTQLFDWQRNIFTFAALHEGQLEFPTLRSPITTVSNIVRFSLDNETPPECSLQSHIMTLTNRLKHEKNKKCGIFRFQVGFRKVCGWC